jgi:hypothetical protein
VVEIAKAFINSRVIPGGIIILPGENGVIDSIASGDIPPVVSGDDFVGTYLIGRDVGLNFVGCGADGIISTTALGDDFYTPGGAGGVGANCSRPIIDAGPNGLIDSFASQIGGDDYLVAATYVVSDPLRRDTDGDSFSDGFEKDTGTNPVQADSDSLTDSDQDALTDAEEALGWLVSIDRGAYTTVTSSSSQADSDFDGLPDFIERDIRSNPNKADSDGDGLSDYDELTDFGKYITLAGIYPGLNIPVSNPSGYGTSPILKDTDGDGLSDYKEAVEGSRLLLPGSDAAVVIRTDPLQYDTDGDGLQDFVEISANTGGGVSTNPLSADTDGDGHSDYEEVNVLGTNPLFFNIDPYPGKPTFNVRLILERFIASKVTGDGGNGVAETAWWFTVTSSNNDLPVLISDARNQTQIPFTTWPGRNTCYEVLLSSNSTTNIALNTGAEIILDPGDSFNFHGMIAEIDSVSADSIMRLRIQL